MGPCLRHAAVVVMVTGITLACGGKEQQNSATPPAGGSPPAAASQPSPSPQPTTAPAPADATKPSEPAQATAPDPAPTDIAVASMLKPWTGDLDGMVERRYIRLLVTFNKTNYFLDGPTQRGATYDGAKLFEQFLNDRLKSKTIQVHIAFIPVSRDRLMDALAEGRGDIAAANLTITPERLKKVD